MLNIPKGPRSISSRFILDDTTSQAIVIPVSSTTALFAIDFSCRYGPGIYTTTNENVKEMTTDFLEDQYWLSTLAYVARFMRTLCEVTDVSLYERMRDLRMKTRLIAVEGNRICSLMHEAARRCYEC